METKENQREQQRYPYPLTEFGVRAFILRAVLDSEGLRRWLLPQIAAKKQARAGRWLGMSQSTINRIVNNDGYDFPLSTVTKFASIFGFVRLSDFVLHVEKEITSRNLSKTTAAELERDTTATSPTSKSIDEAEPKHAHPVPTADYRQWLARFHMDTAQRITAELDAERAAHRAHRQAHSPRRPKSKRGQ